MSWSKRISLDRPLLKVSLGRFGPPPVEKDEAESMADEAYAKGRQEATDELNEYILHNRREVHQLIGQTLEIMDTKIDHCLREIMQGIPELVVGICRQVFSKLDLDGAVVRGVVDDVLQDLPTQRHGVTVYLCPRDLELFRGYVDTMDKDYPAIEFMADPKMESGDCRVESRFGEIDARISTKLRHIEDQLKA
ncbi:MAG: hypothetical protein JW706_09525 [Opitutales bacterium]|nr:hypothetical protein [Opitutales bacterium]